MKTTNLEATTTALRSIFARCGLPTQVVSNNGPPFQCSGYEEFLRQNGIQWILVSPLYLPASNGLAEIFVQTFKYSLESSTSWFSATEDTELPTLIQEHSTRLNRIFPIQAVLATRAKDKVILSKTWPGKPRGKKAYDRQAKFQEKAMGDTVLARDHLYVSSQKWQSGTVLEHKFPHSSKFNWMMGEFGSAMLMMCCKTHQALKPQPPVQHLQKLLKQMLLSVIHTLSLLPQLNLAHHHTQTQDQKRLHLLPVLSCVDQGASKKTL